MPCFWRLSPFAPIQRQECNGGREQPFGRRVGADSDHCQKKDIVPADFPDGGLEGMQRDELKVRRPAGGSQKDIQQNAPRLQTPCRQGAAQGQQPQCGESQRQGRETDQRYRDEIVNQSDE